MMSWEELIEDYVGAEVFNAALDAVNYKRQQGIVVYPPQDKVTRAFKLTPLDKVKVVVLGQDPYHGRGQADGLCFSTPDKKIPPSLRNILKEIDASVEGGTILQNGDLSQWAQQGVLLLNSSLTVEEGLPETHMYLWSLVTDSIIRGISENTENVVFMLWGNYSKSKKIFIKEDRGHCILQSSHPSPLSARRGFFGCNHFNLANDHLEAHGRSKIKW